MKRVLYVTCLLLGAFIGCGSNVMIDPVKPPVIDPSISKSVTLKPLASCDGISVTLKKMWSDQMNDQINNMEQSGCYEKRYGLPAMMPVSSAAGGSRPVDFTTTTTQEKEVDESDRIKTDGKYVYVLTNDSLKIAKVWPLESFGETSTISVEGTPESLFLIHNAVVIFSRLAQKEKVTVVDISHPELPQVLRESFYEGYSLAERRIQDSLHIVLLSPLERSTGLVGFNLLPPKLQNYDCESDDYQEALETLRTKYQKTIDDTDVSQMMPKISHRMAGGDLMEDTLECSDIYASEATSGDSLLQLVTLNAADWTQPESRVALMGSGDSVYASERSLYVTGFVGADQTMIHRFALTPQISYAGSNMVSGHLLSSYSMGEYQGVLSVATTVGHVSRDGRSSVENLVFTLDAKDSELKLLGQISGLAKGEQVYAARFIGSKGYIVTFKKIDPLFVIDLSDPENPKVAGELKVPGFSTALHSFDNDHLIGLGKDAEDQGSFAWYQGLKLSLFDVADAKNPKELHSLIIGGRYSESAALDDAHAFTFDASRKLLALPVSLYKKNSGGSSVGAFDYDGLNLYRVSLDKGFELVNTLKLANTGNENYYNFSSQITRSILIGNDTTMGLVTLDSDGLSVHRLDDQLTEMGSLHWEVAQRGWNLL